MTKNDLIEFILEYELLKKRKNGTAINTLNNYEEWFKDTHKMRGEIEFLVNCFDKGYLEKINLNIENAKSD